MLSEFDKFYALISHHSVCSRFDVALDEEHGIDCGRNFTETKPSVAEILWLQHNSLRTC